MPNTSKHPRPNAKKLAEELREARDLLATYKVSTDRLKPFLLRLHESGVVLPERLADELRYLVGLLSDAANGARPRGRRGMRSPEEKRAIVSAFETARAADQWGGMAAVCRKFSVTPDQVARWRAKLVAGEELTDAPWIRARDPFADALARVELPGSELWPKG